MLEKLSQNLTDVISEVLETMFFVFLEPQSSDMPEYSDFVGAKVAIEGPGLSCELEFLAQFGLLQQVASDFLGIDQESTSLDQCQDVLKEIGNMVAGNLVNICDPEAVFKLGIPTFSGSDLTAASLDGCVEKFVYGTDDGVLLVGLRSVAGTDGK